MNAKIFDRINHFLKSEEGRVGPQNTDGIRYSKWKPVVSSIRAFPFRLC